MLRFFSAVAFGFSLIACTSALPSGANAPMLTGAQAKPSLCVIDGKEANCDEALRMVNGHQGRIESVEFLKGSLAASLYGDRASRGVLVISSRR
jgi:hypothetical protein